MPISAPVTCTFLANIHAEYGIAQYASGELSLREAVISLHTGLDILAATRSDVLAEGKDVSATARFLERLRSDAVEYDLAILDHGSGVSNQAIVMAHASDLNLLVLIPELTSIADCYGLYKLLLGANRRTDCQVLVNRTQDQAEAEYIVEKFTAMTDRFLGQTPGFIGHVPEDSTVRAAVAAQAPIYQVDTNSPAARALNEVSRILAETPAAPLAAEPAITPQAISKTPATADIKG